MPASRGPEEALDADVADDELPEPELLSVELMADDSPALEAMPVLADRAVDPPCVELVEATLLASDEVDVDRADLAWDDVLLVPVAMPESGVDVAPWLEHAARKAPRNTVREGEVMVAMSGRRRAGP
jgi:hypothetical protein